MTKVLTIDMDYITNPYAQWTTFAFQMNPSKRWSDFENASPFDKSHYFIDRSNLMYCFNTFLRSLKSKPKVTFGYDHDSILFAINQEENIDLINIDHHDGIFHGLDHDSDEEYEMVTKHNFIDEGNWGIWLHSQGKLNSFTWIMNKNSDLNSNKRGQANHYLGDKFNCYLKEEYTFENYDFDHVHVCLSPQYIHPDHWHYFSMFISAYEEFYGKDSTIYTEKYETHIRHQKLHNDILNEVRQ